MGMMNRGCGNAYTPRLAPHLLGVINIWEDIFYNQEEILIFDIFMTFAFVQMLRGSQHCFHCFQVKMNIGDEFQGNFSFNFVEI